VQHHLIESDPGRYFWGGGALGYIRNHKTEEKIIQNRKKKFPHNQKPHTKPSKTNAMVTSGAYTTLTLILSMKVFVNVMDLSEAFVSVGIF